MNIEAIKKSFRRVKRNEYPELAGYSIDQIYDGKMGPGGLYLATQMIRRLKLAPGMRVLDLGCGRGATSIFLAKACGVTVVAVDLWILATELFQRFSQQGVADRVVPLNLDIREKLPFANEYFDVIFCMDTVHYYGRTIEFWNHILPHLKPGGELCIGSPCFNDEFSAECLLNLPSVYDDGTNLWPHEFSLYHSPSWWSKLISQTNIMEVSESKALNDGVVYWEDDVLFDLDHNGNPENAMKAADQITYRQPGIPYITFFALHAQKSRQ